MPHQQNAAKARLLEEQLVEALRRSVISFNIDGLLTVGTLIEVIFDKTGRRDKSVIAVALLGVPVRLLVLYMLNSWKKNRHPHFLLSSMIYHTYIGLHFWYFVPVITNIIIDAVRKIYRFPFKMFVEKGNPAMINCFRHFAKVIAQFVLNHEEAYLNMVSFSTVMLFWVNLVLTLQELKYKKPSEEYDVDSELDSQSPRPPDQEQPQPEGPANNQEPQGQEADDGIDADDELEQMEDDDEEDELEDEDGDDEPEHDNTFDDSGVEDEYLFIDFEID